MTERRMRLTDDALRRALVELAGEPDANALLAEVMRTVDTAPQVGRRPWHVPRLERGALLVAALIATLALGAAVALTQPTPEPQPQPTIRPEAIAVRDFTVPFTYVRPEGTPFELRNITGNPHPIYGLTEGRGNLSVFVIDRLVHSCEDLDPSPSAAAGAGITRVAEDPIALLEDLRNEVGVGVGEIRPAMLGNLPGVEAEIDSTRGTCSFARIHVDGTGIGGLEREPLLAGPATLIVARTGETTIAALISADGEGAYEEWLPTAREYLGSFLFDTGDDD
jgi:hypothetical protein